MGWMSQPRRSLFPRRALFTAITAIHQDVGLVAGFLYGSALFWPPPMCNDLDLVLVTRGRQHLIRLELTVPNLPLLSITLADVQTLKADLTDLACAGYLLNKFVNPVSPFLGVRSIIMWQAQALAAIAGVVESNPGAVVDWKDKQFGRGWRSTHPPQARLALQPLFQGSKPLADLAKSAMARGHWEVYWSLHRAPAAIGGLVVPNCHIDRFAPSGG
jgi:hypothetical protein